MGKFLQQPHRAQGKTMRELLMLATPVVRVIVACYLFFHEKDRKYGFISLGVLVILLLGGVFGIGEH